MGGLALVRSGDEVLERLGLSGSSCRQCCGRLGRLLAAEAAPNEWSVQVGHSSGGSILSCIADAWCTLLLIQPMRSTGERLESSFVSR